MKFNIPDRFKSWLAVNPLVLRELRQAVRNKFVVAVLMLMLVVLVGATGFFILAEQLVSVFDAQDFEAGRGLFQVLFAVLSIGCMFFVPLYAGVRLFLERTGENMDLLYITSMKPSKIIRGKVFSASVITLLMFSVCAPFMAFTYMLRGIDLPSIFFVLLALYLVIVLSVQVMLFLVSLPTSRVFKVVLLLPACAGVIFLTTGMNAVAHEWIRSGVYSSLKTWDFWGPALLGLGAGGSIYLLSYVFSVALISPISANRALPIRICLTVLWLLWGITITCMALYYSEGEIMYVWLVMTALLSSAGLLGSVSESDELSARVCRTIPASWWGRRLAFFFYSGPFGGVLWASVMTMVCWVTAWMTFSLLGEAGTFESLLVLLGVYLYAYSYALTASLIVRKLLRGKVPYWSTWVMALMLMAVLLLTMCMVAWWVEDDIWNTINRWQFGNVIVLFDEDYRDMHLVGAVIWALIMTVLNMSWFRDQLRAFRRI